MTFPLVAATLRFQVSEVARTTSLGPFSNGDVLDRRSVPRYRERTAANLITDCVGEQQCTIHHLNNNNDARKLSMSNIVHNGAIYYFVIQKVSKEFLLGSIDNSYAKNLPAGRFLGKPRS